MTIEEIFNKLASHMIEGTLYHDELARAFDFLGLYGYAKCHEYHFIEETRNYKCLSHYYATHYFKLLMLENIERPKLINETWYKYTTKAVDTGTKRNAVKELTSKWVEWERETKKLYQEMRQELCEQKEIAAALFLDNFICDVDKELRHAEKKLIKFETLGYDISPIIHQQESLYKKYKKKLRW